LMNESAYNWLEKLEQLSPVQLIQPVGKVSQIVGLVIEAAVPGATLGELCEISTVDGGVIRAEVVGFQGDKVLLMPLDELTGLAPGSRVSLVHRPLSVAVGDELLGRVLDGLGNPLDGKGPIACSQTRPVFHSPPSPLTRRRIKDPLATGIKAIDGLLTIGKGQRVGIFAGSGVGKSVLLGMMARYTNAAVNVIALIGERGREVREFIERDLGPEGLAHSVVVVATSDQAAMVRIKAALMATTIAEFFRDQGRDVLLLMDSLTRVAMAQREIGLAVGEPPTAKGYTPSVFALLPRLLERAGNSDKGSITGLYTVLVEGDDLDEPISDASRAILDGHIVLSRQLASKGHYPAIDVLQSVSRLRREVTDKAQQTWAQQILELIATYRESEDLISIGAYAEGSNPKVDLAIRKMPQVERFLRQEINQAFTFPEIRSEMQAFTQGMGDQT